jgi:hypothetical protein
MLHPGLVDRRGEFLAEHLKRAAVKKAGLQGGQHPGLELVAAQRQLVRADAAFTAATAEEPMGAANNVTAAADATADES